MSSDDALQRAREAFSQRDWLAARDGFLEAAAIAPLAADDVYTLGDSVWWLGDFSRAASLYEDAYALYIREDRPGRAAFCAISLAGLAFMRGQEAFGSAWLARAVRLLEDLPPGAEHGYLLFTELSGALFEGLAKAVDMARELQANGRTFGDANLVALGVLGEGLALMKQGSVSDGMRLLDEAMLAAVSDELAPEWAGYIYCQLMAACHELGDLQRAREWTRATERWCAGLQSPGPFLGVCRVHRAQIFQVQGAWEQAEAEAVNACAQLDGFDTGNVAEGHYRIGELRRLRGDLAGAERAFREAHGLGRDPQPGLALLRLAQGRVDEAHTSIQTSLATGPSEMLHRAWLCVACVEVSLAAGAVEAARSACDELRATAAGFGSSVLQAAAHQAHGAVLLAEGDAPEALRSLRTACLRWQQLDAPYDIARTRTLLAGAYETLGDHGAAGIELDAAEQVFRSLGAVPDLHGLQQRRRPAALPHGLTERELAVLALVSAGQTNRGIAEALTISEKTVARHLSNIYAKLGISSRTEAARFAFERGLVKAHG